MDRRASQQIDAEMGQKDPLRTETHEKASRFSLAKTVIGRERMMKIGRVLLVDDHEVVLEGLKQTLESSGDFEVIGVAKDGSEAVSMIRTLKPEFVIMDISMRNLNGIDATRMIKEFNQQVKIIIFSMHVERIYVTSLLKYGISGYLLKSGPLSDIILALKTAAANGTFYSSEVRSILQKRLSDFEVFNGNNMSGLSGIKRLSHREKEVFKLLADGLRPKEIAIKLCISQKTVETHKYNIMQKFDVKSVAELTKIAIKENLIKI
ncbi:response regulator [Desulfatiglans anilini]|uniref:response regulator n=1 Tax=Desulfatiglans anilini TaxID=90728 RepID=UPI0012946E02|nr:response regulator transcription factor [Desulfatiglans anilini]